MTNAYIATIKKTEYDAIYYDGGNIADVMDWLLTRGAKTVMIQRTTSNYSPEIEYVLQVDTMLTIRPKSWVVQEKEYFKTYNQTKFWELYEAVKA